MLLTIDGKKKTTTTKNTASTNNNKMQKNEFKTNCQRCLRKGQHKQNKNQQQGYNTKQVSNYTTKQNNTKTVTYKRYEKSQQDKC